MSVVDLRGEIERADWSAGTSPKSSGTVHWPAAAERIRDPLGTLHGYAAYHVSKDWSPEPGIQGADGIQYARAVDQQGNRYLLRDLDAVLWHCDNAFGNATSVPYLLLLAVDEEPSAAMLAALGRQAREDGITVLRPHGPYWTNTACPGDAVRLWLAEGPPMEDDMDEQRIRAIAREEIDAYGKRLQDQQLGPLQDRMDAVEIYARDHGHCTGPATTVAPK